MLKVKWHVCCCSGGAFDPLGLASEDDAKAFRLKTAEIKHGRLAMVAFLGELATLLRPLTLEQSHLCRTFSEKVVCVRHHNCDGVQLGTIELDCALCWRGSQLCISTLSFRSCTCALAVN